MTIYATPFKHTARECSGPSTDSGFDSLDTVELIAGEPEHRFAGMLIYGDGEDRVVFSKIIFRIDGEVSKR